MKDYFTPCNFQFLNDKDLDLGSGGPLLVPVTPPRIVGGGKEGVLYNFPQAALGTFTPGSGDTNCPNSTTVQQVAAFPSVNHGGQTHFGNIHGSPVFWNGPDTARIYAWGENSRLKAYKFSQGKLQEVNTPKESNFRPPDGMPGGMITLSADKNKAGTGIVWAVVPLEGDANEQRGVKGIVLALDAQDVGRTLWTSEENGQRDRLGLFGKFTNPIVAGGKLFVTTYGDQEILRRYPKDPPVHPTVFPQNYYVAVYGPVTPQVTTTINQNRDDVALTRAATTTPLVLDTSTCTPLDPGSVDCTAALSLTANAPSFHRIIFAPNTNVAGCSLLRVTTASKTSGLNNSQGIGFWSASITAGAQSAEDSGLFVPAAKLKVTGTANLLNGAPATLHEFVGVVNCPGADPEPSGRKFKPYMQFFDAANGTVFRNWDLAQNYLITSAVPQFDRSNDVLAH